MDPEAVAQLAHPLDGLVAPFAHHVGRAEVPAQRDAIRVPAEQDDPLGAEPAGGDHGAQPHRPVAHHGDDRPRADPGGERRVVAGRHHVGQGEQRRHQRVVDAGRQGDERPVGLGHPHRLALPAVHAVEPVPPPWRQDGCRPA